MQPAKNRSCPDFTILWQSVPTPRFHPLDGSLLIVIRTIRRDPWPQAHVRSALVVMAYPLSQHRSQMTFTERNQEVQTLAPDRSHQPFAVGVGLWRPNRRPQHSEAERLQFPIQNGGKDRIAVMNEELARMITG
jgi:hypothetical protein